MVLQRPKPRPQKSLHETDGKASQVLIGQGKDTYISKAG